MSNRISVLMAVYNNDQYLMQALKSISVIADQIIIVEGAWNPELSKRSTDNTIQVIDEFIKSSNNKINIEIISYDHLDESSIGALPKTDTYRPIVLANEIRARSMGLSRMTGDWFMLVDSDEIYKPQNLNQLKEYLNNFTGLDDPFNFRIPAFVFYFDYGFGTEEYFPRISRLMPGVCK
jgi:glycosyltransferase involved in cell wall biosynthesis